MKNLKKVLVVLATGVFVAVCIFNVILGSANYDKGLSSLLTLETIAASESSGGGSGGTERCPNPYDVPNRYIKVVSTSNQQKTSNSKGEISVTIDGKTAVKGGYEKNKQIWVVVSVFNCDGIAAGSCCKQSNVRVEID
jgi:hypothetical protein